MNRELGADIDIPIMDSTIYIARTKVGSACDWYDDITKVPTFWDAAPIANQYKYYVSAMKDLIYAGGLARKVDTAVQNASVVLKTAPLPAPEYGEASMNLDETLGSVSMGL